MTTLNEMRRALIKDNPELNFAAMTSDEIEQSYNRLTLSQAEPKTKPEPKPEPNQHADIDSLASSLLTNGMETFKQDINNYIQANIPAPVTKEIEKVIEHTKTITIQLDQNGNQIIPKVDPQPVGSKSAKELFNLKKADYDFPCFDYTEDSPQFYDLRHLHDSGLLKVVSYAQHNGKHLWLSGEKATGKTTFVQYLAATTGRPFIRIQHHKAMEPKDLVGSFQIPDGKSVWHDGALTQALRIPNAVILLDEPDVNPAACELYQSLLDEGYLTIEETGEKVYMAQGVNVFVTGNTAGHGDQTGRYDGTMSVNGAFLDRFFVQVPMQYMSATQEAQILNRHGLNDNQAALVAEFAFKVRSQVQQGQIEEPVSLRRLISFAELIAIGVEQSFALDTSILNFVRHSQDREIYHQLANAHMPQLKDV